MAAAHILILLCLFAPMASDHTERKPRDCYVYDGERALYNGTQDVSSEGRSCKVGPHSVPNDLDRYYCNDSDGSGYTWCWTQVSATNGMQAQTRKEACNVSHCPSRGQRAPLLETCYVYNPKTHEALYQGRTATTKSGRRCQEWYRKYPQDHTAIINFQRMGFLNIPSLSNYCRDPYRLGYPWCFTMQRGIRLEECDVPYCSSHDLHEGVFDLNDCYVYKSKAVFPRALYTGNVSVTVSGLACQPWNREQPHQISPKILFGRRFGIHDRDALKNFCRDFDGLGQPWCYTMSRDVRREKCPVKACKASSPQGDNSKSTELIPPRTKDNSKANEPANGKEEPIPPVNDNNSEAKKTLNGTEELTPPGNNTETKDTINGTEELIPAGNNNTEAKETINGTEELIPPGNSSETMDDFQGMQLSYSTILGLAYTPCGAAFITILLVLLVYWRKFAQLNRESRRARPAVP